MNTIAYGNDRFVAAGASGIVVHSADGLEWERSRGPAVLSSIVYAEPYFLAVGEDRALHRSSDGVEWEKIRDFTTTNVQIGGRKGLYLMRSSEGVEMSTDLESWEPVEALQGVGRIAVQDQALWVNGRTTAFGDFEILRSEDGLSWTVITSIGSGTRLLGNSDSRIVVERQGEVFASTDSEDWQRIGDLNIGSRFLSFAPLADDGFILFDEHNRFVNYGDDDLMYFDSPVGDLTNSFWVPNDFAFGSGKIVAIGDAGYIAAREPGEEWLEVNTAVPNSLNILIPVGNNWLLTGHGAPVALHSPDGVNWSDIMLPDLGNRGQFAVRAAESYAVLFVASDHRHGSEFFHSENGVDWEPVQAVDVNVPLSYSMWGDRFAVEARDGTFHATDDGRVWTPVTGPAESPNGELVVGPRGLYWLDAGAGYWHLESGSDFADAEWVSVPGLEALYPGDEVVLAQSSQGGLRIDEAGNLHPASVELGIEVDIVWADGYFWRLVNGIQLSRSTNGSGWASVYRADSELPPHLAGSLSISGTSMIYRESLYTSGDFRFWSSSKAPSPATTVGLNQPRDLVEAVVGDVVAVELSVDGDASTIAKAELWLGDSLYEATDSLPLRWELNLESAGGYEFRTRVQYSDGRIQVIRDRVQLFMQLRSGRELSDKTPEDVVAEAVFQNRLYFATDEDGTYGTYWMTLDGYHWQKRTIPFLSTITDFVVTEDRIIAQGSPYHYAVSKDGARWERLAVPDGRMFSDGKLFWLRSRAEWSMDGRRWFATGLEGRIESVAYGHGRHYLETTTGNWSSDDLINWEVETNSGRYQTIDDKVYFFADGPNRLVYRLDELGAWEQVAEQVDQNRDYAFVDGSYYRLGNQSQIGYSFDTMDDLSKAGADLEGSLQSIVEFNGVIWMRFAAWSMTPIPLGSPGSIQQMPELVTGHSGAEWSVGEEEFINVELQVPNGNDAYIRWFKNGEEVTDSVGTDLAQSWPAEEWGAYEIHAEWSADGEDWLQSNVLTFHVGLERETGVLDGPRFYRDDFFPLSDRVLVHVGDDHIFTMDGLNWFYLDPDEVIYDREVQSIFSNRYGTIARVEDDLIISPDHLFWYSLNHWFQGDRYTIVPTEGSTFLIHDLNTGDLSYFDVITLESGVLEIPWEGATLHYGQRLDDGRWFFQADSLLYVQDEEGSWGPVTTGSVMPLQVAGGRFWATDNYRNIMWVSKNLKDWEPLIPPVGNQRIHGYYYFEGIHYLLTGSPVRTNTIFNSRDGKRWVQAGSVQYSDPRLFEINGTLMLYQYSRSVQLTWINSPPEPLADEELDLRLFFFPLIKGDSFALVDPYGQFGPFIGTDAGWVWSPVLGWLWPGDFGYPFYLFWSERHDGWLITDHANSDYWYSFRHQTWGYLYPDGTNDPWRSMPSQLLPLE
ncbi:MAG: hypothetical protein JJU20_04180 [Opitutales bacterium]|nr:hypothetical protein [Opitutales bacterium]